MSLSKQNPKIRLLNPQLQTNRKIRTVTKIKSDNYNSVAVKNTQQPKKVANQITYPKITFIKHIQKKTLSLKQLPVDKQHFLNYLVAKKHKKWVTMMFREAMNFESDFLFIFEYYPKIQIDFESKNQVKLRQKEQINNNLLALVFERKSQKILQCSLMMQYRKKDQFFLVATGNLPSHFYFKQDQNFVFGDDQIVISNDGSLLKTNLGKGEFEVNIEAKDKFQENYMTGLFLIKQIKSIEI